MARKNLVTGCIWLCLFGFLFSMKFSHPEQVGHWPTMIFTLGIVLSAALIVNSTLQLKRSGGGSISVRMSGESIRKVAVSGTLVFLWIFLFARIGYLVTTVVSMFLFMAFNEPQRTKRNLLRDAAAAFLFPLAMFFIFSALGVRFPRGILI